MRLDFELMEDAVEHGTWTDRHSGAVADAAPAVSLPGDEELDRLWMQVQEIILLTEWERLSPAEAALGIKPGTARVRLHRARQALATDPELAALLVEGPNAPAVVLDLGFTRSAAVGGGCH